MNRIAPKHPAAYEADFALWSAEQAARIREGRLDGLDRENLAGEIESLGRGDRHEIRNRLIVILTHLLKWQFQPEARTNSWRASLLVNRDAIAALIEDSPSLRSHPATVVPRAFRLARVQAAAETGLPESDFPDACPCTIEQILDPDFLPGQQ
jgi:hypothetical protein